MELNVSLSSGGLRHAIVDSAERVHVRQAMLTCSLLLCCICLSWLSAALRSASKELKQLPRLQCTIRLSGLVSHANWLRTFTVPLDQLLMHAPSGWSRKLVRVQRHNSCGHESTTLACYSMPLPATRSEDSYCAKERAPRHCSLRKSIVQSSTL